jgi:pimeloyl-ACP methyl ester carboxylesterase
MSVLTLRDEIVHYEALGRGKPLIFLHGWVGSWRYWIPTMQAASISFRTYALDLWGFGDTAKNPYLYSIEQQLNLIDLFMLEMGIAKIAIIGHGLGAVVGLLFAERNPRLVDRMMAISTPNGDPALYSRLLTSSPGELAEWLAGRLPGAEPARAEAPKTDQKAIQMSLVSIQNLDLKAIYQSLSVPCLFVNGQNDPAIPNQLNDNLLILPDTMHQITFDTSGHFPMLDEPSKFNRLMADFLALGSGTSPSQLQLKEEWRRRVR